ncbi:NAD(P)H-binding protein [Actinomadura sp. ATCC 31491]|uniref:NAD(P)H-binding protein n=1 Tax=Actinomadura luzonensis TaxID=2805427 RepID=A0ABT0FVJ9_9ACTN|nr:NAD(P)H-binding protein [Actinomadura luzonensis]MCK2215956.1 NAD(P)H-binding protein [Actinomadura luzonensis]
MIFVTGATGTVGRAAVDLLLEAGEKVTAVTRDPGRARLPEGARVVRGDPSAPATLEEALDGARAMLLSPRAAGRGLRDLLALAAGRGVERVVLLSAVTVVHPAGRPEFAAGFRAAEEAVAAAVPRWTFLRCADFAANTLSWAPQIRATGVVRGAYGDAATSPIHERDIAAVAVHALTGQGHDGQAYVLTGPHSLTQRDKARLIGEAIGRTVGYEEVPPEQVRQAMLGQGLPEEIPDRLLGSLADYAERPGPATDAVPAVLGRPALTFAAWAAEHAGAFRRG